ncbi:cell division protein FtsX [Palleronia sediminis]|uniref:Cell division protein FtsX n=2 Tax=Palleronia sediminis TaxID=2547833 RepID=A0A4R6ACW0_9RHOB|nr:FtsX-like permease family protein [Palleronia sediminis]TDL81670.1 cell division protein FtsX [Palleronia sediminis]
MSITRPERGSDGVVPPTGFTARLTQFTAAGMAFLAVFALALSMATERLADRWGEALAQSATIRISAPSEQRAAQTEAVLEILGATPGVAQARALDATEQQALLAPFFGPDLPVETLPIPQLVEIVTAPAGFDAEGLRLRLRAEVPGAVLDDHTAWRRPLIAAAERLSWLGIGAMALIALMTAAMTTLAAGSALAANRQVLQVLRLVGAQDGFIARAFVRRFTFRALTGAALGTLAGMLAIWSLPEVATGGGFLTGLGFSGAGWLAPLPVPFLTAVVAFLATRMAAFRALRAIP